MAKLTVTAPGWNRYKGQMSSVPPARSTRQGASAMILMQKLYYTAGSIENPAVPADEDRDEVRSISWGIGGNGRLGADRSRGSQPETSPGPKTSYRDPGGRSHRGEDSAARPESGPIRDGGVHCQTACGRDEAGGVGNGETAYSRRIVLYRAM